jgi:hypothetical protein
MALHDHEAQQDLCRYRLAAGGSYRFFSVSAVVVGRFLRRLPKGYNTLWQRLQLPQNPPACALLGPSVTWLVSLIPSDRV